MTTAKTILIKCPDCRRRPGFSEIARHFYGISDAPCERCNGDAEIMIEIPNKESTPDGPR